MRTGKRRKGRRTRREIDALLGRYHQSGLSVAAFCEAEGVSDNSVYRWLKQERDGTAKPAVVEVKPAGTVPGMALTLETPGGYRIEVPASFSSEALERLLSLLA